MSNTYYADEGFVFRRISDGMVYGSEITLGYTYYLNGEALSSPHKDVIEDFVQVQIDSIKTE